MNDRNARYFIDICGKAWPLPLVYSIVPLLEEYPRNPKFDANIGSRLPRSMKRKVENLKRKTGMTQADMVRLGLAEFLRRAESWR